MRRVWYAYDKKTDTYIYGDTAYNLADKIGKTANAIYSGIGHAKAKGQNSKYGFFEEEGGPVYRSKRGIKVVDHKTGEVYRSISEAARALGVSRHILDNLKKQMGNRIKWYNFDLELVPTGVYKHG